MKSVEGSFWVLTGRDMILCHAGELVQGLGGGRTLPRTFYPVVCPVYRLGLDAATAASSGMVVGAWGNSGTWAPVGGAR